MYYEPDTIWGRTIEGDQEVATPKSGLSLVQRRVLCDLGQPRPFAVIAARYGIQVPKLENELIALAERRLVAFQRPGATQPRTAPGISLAMPPGMADDRKSEPWKPPLPVYLLAIALGIGSVLLILS